MIRLELEQKINDHLHWLNNKGGSQLDLISENIKEFRFEDLNLNSSIYTDTALDNISFINTNLSGTYFINCVFNDVVFQNVNLRKSEFHDCKFRNCILKNSNVTKVEFLNLKAESTNFIKIDLGWSFIDSSDFSNGKFDEINLESILMSDTKMVGTNFKNLNFSSDYPMKLSQNKVITLIKDEASFCKNILS